MIRVIFECYESMNEYQEEMEFEDDATDDEIAKEFSQWVWEQVGDNYGWQRKGDHQMSEPVNKPAPGRTLYTCPKCGKQIWLELGILMIYMNRGFCLDCKTREAIEDRRRD